MQHPHALPAAPASTPATDPVCGMTVADDSPYRHDYKGRICLFCIENCRAKFVAIPAKYVTPEPNVAPSHPDLPHGTASATAHAATDQASPSTVWVCPMHPEVRQNAPGACPKC